MNKIINILIHLIKFIMENGNEEKNEKLSLVSNYRIIDNSFIFFKRFVIGSGSFGKVLYGMNAERTRECAVKFEKSTVKNSVIYEEIKILNDLKGGEGIPEIYWYGEYDEYKVMIMDLLGPSLDKYFKICQKTFDLDTTLNLGIQMVRRIEYVHDKGYLHRDIKPNNFLLGKFSREMKIDDCVYIIDFGLSKSYIDPDTKNHYSFKEDRRFVGTPRYASLNTHLGVRQSRRDDLESIIFILVYFLKGDLPWQGVKAKTKSEKKRKIMRKKKSVSPEELCSSLPIEFNTLLNYIRSIKFEEKPDYEYICNLLSFTRSKYTNDCLEWEWNIMFLSTKNSSNDDKVKDYEKDFNNFNKFKKHYLKLYEGYPIPSYEEFLDVLEKKININKYKKDNSNHHNSVGSKKDELNPSWHNDEDIDENLENKEEICLRLQTYNRLSNVIDIGINETNGESLTRTKI